MISAAPQLFWHSPRLVKRRAAPARLPTKPHQILVSEPGWALANEDNATLGRMEQGRTQRWAAGVLPVVRGNRCDFKASELSRLNNIISVILPDTFSYNLSFRARSPPPHQRRRKELYFLVILYKVERQVSSLSLISCTLKTVCV